MLRNRLLFLLAVLLQGVMSPSGFAQIAANSALAPFHSASSFSYTPIVDNNNKILTTVDLYDGTMASFSAAEDPTISDRKNPMRTTQQLNAIAAFERAYGFATVYMTSWVGESFTAYLSAEQVQALRADPRVAIVSEVVPAELSVILPPWANSLHSGTITNEADSWGRTAMNGKISNGTGRVYVLDEGVGYSQDNANVITRVNASCGPYGSVCGPSTPVVGCFAHATHVAGIIGAPYGNLGTAGVDAGVPIISVSVAPNRMNTHSDCVDDTSITTATIANGLDYIKWDVSTHSYPTLSVVNMSINGNGGIFSQASGSLFAKIQNLITPVGTYPGVFFAQSAGNDYTDACQYAFAYTSGMASALDGLMVVGGIDKNAKPVIGGLTAGGACNVSGGCYDNTSVGYGVEPGSNYGACIDVWAPSKTIDSTWGGALVWVLTDKTTWQVGGTTYNVYENLSGTSMAAPHIAGMAAYLIESLSLPTPVSVETNIRNDMYNVGKYDSSTPPLLIWMTQLP